MAPLSNSRRSAAFILSIAAFVLLLVAPSVQANANIGDKAAHLVQVRHHNRMIRVRAPQRGPGHENPGKGEGSDLLTSTTTTDSSTTTPLTSTTSGGPFSSLTDVLGGSPTTTTSIITTSSASSTTPISTSSPVLNTTTTSSTPSTSTTTSTSSTTTSSLTSTTKTPDPPGSTSTVIVAASSSTTSNVEIPTGGPSAATSQRVSIARRTIVVLIAIAGSIGVVFLVWTGIRKWKFRPSRGFEDRMQDPINWQPNAVGYDHSDPASRIAAHRRNVSAGSHGSFGSSEMAHNNTVPPVQYAGYGATGATGVNRNLSGHGVASQHSNEALPPLPPHDFTAGASGFDAYEFYHGQGPQHMPGMSASPPQMVENGLARGGSIARPVSVRSENPYDGLDEDYNQQPALPPHHGGAYAAPPAPPSYHGR